MHRLNDTVEIKEQSLVEIAPTASVSEAAGQLVAHKIGALVVRDGQRRLVGIVSERDIVRAAATSDPAAMGKPVSTVMSRDVQTCEPSSDILELLTQMDKHHIRHLPVVADDDLVGIISIRDVMSAILDHMRRENEDLRDMSDLLAELCVEVQAVEPEEIG